MRSEITSVYPDKKSVESLSSLPRWTQQRKITNNELARSNKELAQFAFLAAHDLQEPLRVASSYTQLLHREYKGKLDENADKIISSILKCTERMQRLIQGLLEYAQAGKGNVQFKKLDCGILLNRAMDNLKVAIEESSAQIKYDDCPVIKGDEVQLTQLFQNLLNNAIKFRKKNENPCIHISAGEKDDQWFFSVQDNGIGVEPEHTQRIFDLYQRLHSQSEYAGNGIGLAVCKKIVELHRGEIWLESELGKGTTVYFTIHKTNDRKGHHEKTTSRKKKTIISAASGKVNGRPY